MIFLHDEDTRYPTGTAEWLKDRFWVNSHYHVKCPRRMFSKKTKYSKLVIQGPPPDINSDFSRLARVVTGQTVGLVLGGGGARGCSHVGIIRALLEAGIPIDHVGGVSIGSLIGGLYTRERDLTEVTVKARDFAGKVGQVWRWLMDLTLPVTSYFKGYQFNKILEPLFGSDTDMRDTWLPYFNITTNISNSTVRIHDYGSLWRYVRASMSLAGWMSPICDPHDGHLLLDGGYSNNLPADVMRTMGARYIFAVDVGAEDTSDFTNYGDYLSGFQVSDGHFFELIEIFASFAQFCFCRLQFRFFFLLDSAVEDQPVFRADEDPQPNGGAAPAGLRFLRRQAGERQELGLLRIHPAPHHQVRHPAVPRL